MSFKREKAFVSRKSNNESAMLAFVRSEWGTEILYSASGSGASSDCARTGRAKAKHKKTVRIVLIILTFSAGSFKLKKMIPRFPEKENALKRRTGK